MTAAVTGAKAFRERWIMQPRCPRRSIVGREKTGGGLRMRLMRLPFKYKPNIYFRFDIHFLTDIKQDNEVEKWKKGGDVV